MAETTRRRTKPAKRTSRRNKLSKLISIIEKRIKAEAEGGKTTVADYIRLAQLERDLDEDEQPAEIKVTWVEPQKQSDTEI